METIVQYLESMFKGFPKTEEVSRIKEDLKMNMEEKYEELKKEGKSENEAIGIVISEFGNIDELMQEMGVDSVSDTDKDDTPMLSLDEVKAFLSFSHQHGKSIALGVLMILIGISLMLLLSTFIITDGSRYEAFVVLPLLLFVIPAVAIFIYSGMKSEQYDFIEKGLFNISASTKEFLTNDLKQKMDTQIKTLIFSVCLFILSPLLVILSSEMNERVQITSVSIMILIIGIGVYLIIRFCAPMDSYKKLLKIDEYATSNKKTEKIIGAIASVVWPLAAAFFLFMGFFYGAWDRAWIIFPVMGVSFGAVSGLVHYLKDEK